MSTVRVVNIQHTDATEPNIVLEADGTTVFASGITISGGTNLTVSGTAEFASGTVSAPSITFIDDNNTGLYEPAADTVAITTAATERLRIDSSGKVGIGTTSPAITGLTIENASVSQGLELEASSGFAAGPTVRGYYRSGSAYKPLGLTGSSVILGIQDVEKARIDSSGRLLVGTTSSTGITGIFQAVGSSSVFHRTDNDQYPSIVYLSKARGTGAQIVANNDNIGNVSFAGYDGTNPIRAAEIGAYVDGTPGTNDMPGRLVLATTVDGASSPTTRITIDKIGTTTVAQPTSDYPASPAVEYYTPPGKYPLRFNLADNNDNWVDFCGGYQNTIGTGAYIRFRPTFQNVLSQAGMYIGGISTTIQNTDLIIGKVICGSNTSTAASKTEVARFLNGGGLTFNGDTAAANALDDYEEGSFNPTIKNWNGTYNTQNGTYVKIGKMVFCQGEVITNGSTGTSMDVFPGVDSLPFVPGTDITGGSGSISQRHMGTATIVGQNASMPSGDMAFVTFDNGGGAALFPNNISNTQAKNFSRTYISQTSNFGYRFNLAYYTNA
jgi:hypothetical protein